MAEVGAERGSKTGTVVVGTLILIMMVFDAILFGLPIMGLAAWNRTLVVFVVSFAVLVALNIAACSWIERKWDAWVAGSRVEARLQKIRDGKRAQRPIGWMNRGSDWWFGIAAAMLNAIQVIALSRLITGQRSSQRRLVIASVAYSLFIAGIFSLFGYALGDVIRAL